MTYMRSAKFYLIIEIKFGILFFLFVHAILYLLNSLVIYRRFQLLGDVDKSDCGN
jgi:hypothetical protein